MTLDFDESSHTYTLDGKRLPSVTQIIQSLLPMPQVDPWYLERGTATHKACELLDRGTLNFFSVDPAIENRVKAWIKFRRDWPAEIIANEKRLASAKHQFAGTVDRVFEHAGRAVIADLKNSVTPQVRLQLAAYSLLFTENVGGKACSAVAVELLESGEYRCHWIEERELRRLERQFLALLSVYSFAEQHKILREK